MADEEGDHFGDVSRFTQALHGHLFGDASICSGLLSLRNSSMAVGPARQRSRMFRPRNSFALGIVIVSTAAFAAAYTEWPGSERQLMLLEKWIMRPPERSFVVAAPQRESFTQYMTTVLKPYGRESRRALIRS